MASKRKHSKCKGTGTYTQTTGHVTNCLGCTDGYVTVYTPQEKVERESLRQRRSRALALIKARAGEIQEERGPWDNFADVVRSGFDQLEQREPERLIRLYASVEASRVDDVVRALYDYRTSLGY